MIRCPKCKCVLMKQEHTYRCPQGHSYDIAKRGYVNLLTGNHKASGDDKEMIQARTNFLSHGYYQRLADELSAILSELAPQVIVDAGCGEGYYTNQIACAFDNVTMYGFDLSKYGIHQACIARTNVQYGVANVFHLPLPDTCTDTVLSVFAPYDLDEFMRIMQEGGYFIKVGPGPRHLMGIKRIMYDEVYENTETTTGHSGLKKIDDRMLDYTINIENQADIWALFQMTPYYWKSPKAGSERLKNTQKLETNVQFHIEVYQKI